MTQQPPALLTHFAPLARNYDVLLCDVWGVIHNGVAAFPETCDALSRFRDGGGMVVLLTNSPRPNEAVAAQLDGFKVPRSVYDGIVTSGDVTRAIISSRPGQRAFHLGPARDLPIFAGLDVTLADAEAADYVVCSGLFHDDTETPDDYRVLLGKLRGHDLFMLCANPDVMVERGDVLVYCAGALADAYAALGGEVLFAGKPHRPIYERALALAQTQRGRLPDLARVLAIGDSVRTDLTGAAAMGLDFLFVASGLHATDIGPRGAAQNPQSVAALFGPGPIPKAVTPRLIW